MAVSKDTTAAKAVVDKIVVALTPGGKQIWEMGKRGNRSALEAGLRASGVEDMWIRDDGAEAVFKLLRERVDGSKDRTGWGILHWAVDSDYDDDGFLLRRLLALGLDPDLPARDGSRPSHFCLFATHDPHPLCAKVLALCRPDLKAADSDRQTPADRARRLSEYTYTSNDARARHKKIEDTFNKFSNNGFPSLAQLACDKNWYAVKNLCRRRATNLEEVRRPYNGKDAVEWAEFHNQNELAEEIRFLFKYQPPPIKVVEHKVTKMAESVEATQDTLAVMTDTTVASIASVVESQLEAHLAAADDKVTESNKVVQETLAVTATAIAGVDEQVRNLALSVERNDEHVKAIEEAVRKELKRVLREIDGVRSLVADTQDTLAASGVTHAGAAGTHQSPVQQSMSALCDEICRRATAAGLGHRAVAALAELVEKFPPVHE